VSCGFHEITGPSRPIYTQLSLKRDKLFSFVDGLELRFLIALGLKERLALQMVRTISFWSEFLAEFGTLREASQASQSFSLTASL
jgi:hypothetical protein